MRSARTTKGGRRAPRASARAVTASGAASAKVSLQRGDHIGKLRPFRPRGKIQRHAVPQHGFGQGQNIIH